MTERICLAVGDSRIENWLIREVKNPKNKIDAVFTKPATYRGIVLERVAMEMPTILILKEDLPAGGEPVVSFDTLIKQIKVKFKNCRIIIIAGDHQPGDEFLKLLVSRGIYDIITGSSVKMIEVINCIKVAKDYGYAEKLQGIETKSDSDVMSVEVVPSTQTPHKSIFKRNKEQDYSELAYSEVEPGLYQPYNITPPQNSQPKKEAPKTQNQPSLVQSVSVQQTPQVQQTPPAAQSQPSPRLVSQPQTASQTPAGSIKAKAPDYGTSVLSGPIPGMMEDSGLGGIVFEYISQTQQKASSPSFDTAIKSTVPSVQKPQTEPVQQSIQQPVQQPSLQPQPVQKTTQNVSGTSPVGNSRVLTSDKNNFKTVKNEITTGFMPDITVFAGAREGVGCTTVCLNTAYSLAAMGKKVIVIDAVWKEKSIFDKMHFVHETRGFMNNNSPMPPVIKGSFYKEITDNKGRKIGGIQFLELATTPGMADDASVINLIKSLSGFDHVLLDFSLAYFNNLLAGIAGIADKIVAVTLQDDYEWMMLKSYLNAYQSRVDVYNKLIVVMNRANPKIQPSVRDMAKYIITNNIFLIPPDFNNFSKAAAQHTFYSGKKKIREIYSLIAEKIKRGR